ncbi:MAG: flagellar export chaperone FliS [Gammaproteobacteria bacterium]
MINSNRAARVYSGMGQQGLVEDANSHRLITMLFDGALDRLAAARGAMERREIISKGQLISKVITIVDGLRAHLDMDKGGVVAQNLRDLYDYMERKLFEANANNAPEMLEEVSSLIRTLRSGWVEIEDEVTRS